MNGSSATSFSRKPLRSTRASKRAGHVEPAVAPVIRSGSQPRVLGWGDAFGDRTPSRHGEDGDVPRAHRSRARARRKMVGNRVRLWQPGV